MTALPSKQYSRHHEATEEQDDKEQLEWIWRCVDRHSSRKTDAADEWSQVVYNNSSTNSNKA